MVDLVEMIKAQENPFAIEFDNAMDAYRAMLIVCESWALPEYDPALERPRFDKTDLEILKARAAYRYNESAVMVGDFVEMPNGDLERVTIRHSSQEVQGTGYDCRNGQGRPHLTAHGGGSYSGSCGPTLWVQQMRFTGKYRLGSFWFFHHGRAGAHRGVDCVAPCRVWKFEPLYDGVDSLLDYVRMQVASLMPPNAEAAIIAHQKETPNYTILAWSKNTRGNRKEIEWAARSHHYTAQALKSDNMVQTPKMFEGDKWAIMKEPFSQRENSWFIRSSMKFGPLALSVEMYSPKAGE